MLKFLSSVAIALTLVFAPVQKSEAAVGLIAAPAVIVVGGVVAAVGGVLTIDAFAEGPICTAPGFDGILSCLFTGVVGLSLAGVGLLILDGEQELAFAEANSSMKHLKGVSAEEIAVYNSELDQLNAINAEITAEVKADKSVDAKARWSEMSSLVSPETMKIAALNGEALLKSIR